MTLKLCMIGAGYFAQFQAEAWSRLSGVQLVAIADAAPQRAEAFAQQWRIPRAYHDVQAMLTQERPAVVDIVTRPPTHLMLTRLAAAQGAHIICQKPMAPTRDECVQMIEACEAAHVRLLIHENWRWQPWYREMKRLLDAGVVGKPFHINFTLRTGDGRGQAPYAVQPYFREMQQLLIYETLVHFLDTFRFLLGEIASINCQTRTINPNIIGEDHALVQMTFRNNATGVIDANRHSGPTPNSLTLGVCTLEGDAAMVRLTHEGRLYLTRYGQPECEHLFPTAQQGYKGDSVFATQAHLIECLQTGRLCESEGRDYLQTVKLVEACYRSAADHQVILL